MIFGKWKPCGAFGGALLFGFVDALQIKLQIAGVHVPYQFLSMAPYVITMIVLAGLIGRAATCSSRPAVRARRVNTRAPAHHPGDPATTFSPCEGTFSKGGQRCGARIRLSLGPQVCWC